MYREDPRALGGYQVILMIRFLFCFIFCTVFIFFSSLFFSFFWASFNSGNSLFLRLPPPLWGIGETFSYLSGFRCVDVAACVLYVHECTGTCIMCAAQERKKRRKKKKKQKPQNPHFSNHPLSPSHPDKNPFRSRTNEGMEAGKCTRERWNCGGKWS